MATDKNYPIDLPILVIHAQIFVAVKKFPFLPNKQIPTYYPCNCPNCNLCHLSSPSRGLLRDCECSLFKLREGSFPALVPGDTRRQWYSPPKVFHHHNQHQHDINHTHQHLQEHSHQAGVHHHPSMLRVYIMCNLEKLDRVLMCRPRSVECVIVCPVSAGRGII